MVPSIIWLAYGVGPRRRRKSAQLERRGSLPDLAIAIQVPPISALQMADDLEQYLAVPFQSLLDNFEALLDGHSALMRASQLDLLD